MEHTVRTLANISFNSLYNFLIHLCLWHNFVTENQPLTFFDVTEHTEYTHDDEPELGDEELEKFLFNRTLH